MTEKKLNPNELASEILSERQKSYVAAFEGKQAEIALADLKQFCRAEESTFHADPRVHAVLEGRREVYLRIMDHLEKSLDELVIKYTKGA